MDFSWTILCVVVLINSFWMAAMFAAQQLDKSLPPRHSLIPGTQQGFLYMQDFYTFWGDLIAVPLIVNVFVHLAVNGFIGLWQWLIFFAVAIADAFGFLLMCLRNDHKPDQGYPDIGKVSWNGWLHLPYHGFGIAMSVFVIWNIIAGNPVLAFMAVFGGAIYIASFIADIQDGNFAPLKKEADPP